MGVTAVFDATRNNLQAIRDFVESRAVELGMDADPVYEIMAAVDEAAANVIMHGYGDQGGLLEIEADQESGMMVVRLRDQAPLYDPTTRGDPDISHPLEDRPLGGMGFALIRKYTDKVAHRSLPDGGNELTLYKKIA